MKNFKEKGKKKKASSQRKSTCCIQRRKYKNNIRLRVGNNTSNKTMQQYLKRTKRKQTKKPCQLRKQIVKKGISRHKAAKIIHH